MIRRDLIDYGKRRPGTKITPQSLTIHSTGNPDSTAQNERDFLNSSYNTGVASWHVCVDEKEAVMAIPLYEMAHHAGSKEGNRLSVSLEICESGNRVLALERAIETAAQILGSLGLSADDLCCHRDWNGKNCPQILLDEGLWEWFCTRVREKMEQKRVTPLAVELPGMVAEGYLMDGTAYAPVRRTCEALGCRVHYSGGKVRVDK